ncbi:hypothetical protein [Mucilaginibacter sp.]|uniref:hypothetical protein n=1 Tax=Mucilaginibacter sp. TaxID=1882438 RepID=UPI00262FFE05|nr:hypothetical protein [Mucilaginibacter sp.]MDB4925815.1 hypothetical protein [Mucilaginibacter sp.]
MKKEKNIDTIFKHSLADPVDEAAYREDDWDAFEQMLNKNKKSGSIFWLPILGSVAAAILILFGWLMFKPQGTNHEQKIQQQVAVNKTQQTIQQPAITVTTTQKAQQQIAATKQSAENTGEKLTAQPAATAATPKTRNALVGQPQHKKTQQEYIAKNNYRVGRHNGNNNLPQNARPLNGQNNGNAVEKIGSDHNPVSNTRDYEALAAVSEAPGITSSNTLGTLAIASINILPQAPDALVQTKSGKIGIKKTASSFRPQFALSALASSELNGVGSLQNPTKGYNYGLLFSAELVKKFTITTGVNYSFKPYTLPFADYHTTYKFKNAPEYVSADCRVLDIPINIGYQVYNNHRNKITVGTGLSSYIMMHESYTYDYGNTATLYGPSYYAVKTRGKYLFSIMNLEATYQRQINSKVGISLQPYLKVPLSNIGYSQIKVETAGLAVGLNWNINSLTKPK